MNATLLQLAATVSTYTDAFNSGQVARRQQVTRDHLCRMRAAAGGPLRRNGLQVLVVDSEASSAERMSEAIRDWGHRPHLALDGFAALRMAAVERPQVVLLELDLPVMDGCQIARRLRVDHPEHECFIIALSDRTDYGCRLRCREAGIDLVLARPVDPSVIEALLMLESVRLAGHIRPLPTDSSLNAVRDRAPTPMPEGAHLQGELPCSEQSC